jgi:hypothetical protein
MGAADWHFCCFTGNGATAMFSGGRTLMPRRRRRITSVSITLAVLTAAGATALLAGIGPAGAFTPGEGLGAAWCSQYGGKSLGSYRDVYACVSSTKTAGKTPFDSFGGFQPTELTNRYLYAVTRHTLFDNDVAGNFVALASASFALPAAASAAGTSLPGAGDIISMWGGRSKQKENGDHTQVAIVTAVTPTSSGWTIRTLNQGDPSDTNAGKGFDTITVSASRQTWSAEYGFYADFAWLRLAPDTNTGGGSNTAGGNGWLAAEAPQRSSVQPGRLLAVACGSTTSCTAVGTSGGAAMLVAKTGTTWKSVTVPLPASTATGASLQTVTCPSASACVAGGSYHGSGQQQGLLLAGQAGTWTATTAPLPAGAAASPGARIMSVACASSTSCVAVGQYATGKSDDALLVTGHGSAWSGRPAPLPADAAARPAAELVSVACPAVTSCTAVGSYLDDLGNRQGMLVTLRGTSWKATRAPLPAGATVPGAELSAVACPAASGCVAVGLYSADSAGFEVSGTGASWAATATPLPAQAASSPATTFPALACQQGTCVAVGSYTDTAGSRQGLIVSGRGSSLTATTAPLPKGSAPAQGSPGARLTSVACPSAAACVAVGEYTDTSGDAQTLLLTGAGSAWTTARAPVPANARTVGSQAQGALAPPALEFITCRAAATCVAVGSYPAARLGMEGFIVSGQA